MTNGTHSDISACIGTGQASSIFVHKRKTNLLGKGFILKGINIGLLYKNNADQKEGTINKHGAGHSDLVCGSPSISLY